MGRTVRTVAGPPVMYYLPIDATDARDAATFGALLERRGWKNLATIYLKPPDDDPDRLVDPAHRFLSIPLVAARDKKIAVVSPAGTDGQGIGLLMLPTVVLFPLILQAASPRAAAPVLLERLTCMDRLDNGRWSSGEVLMMWSSSRGHRLKNLHVYSDGWIFLRSQWWRDDLLDCKAKISLSRLEAFKAEVLASKVWRLRGPRHLEGDAISLYLDLDRRRRCDWDMRPKQWETLAATRAMQAAIDRLKLDVCQGQCPKPRNEEPEFPTPESRPTP